MLETVHCIDKYVLSELLRRGTVTEMWKAQDYNLRRPVVIKLLQPSHQAHADCIQRFHQQARLLARLNHPNITQVYDISLGAISTGNRDDTLPYIVMSYLVGPSLADYIAHTSHLGKFPSTAELMQLFIAIGSAIDYAHWQGVASLGIQPAHILLDQRNTIYPMGEPMLVEYGFLQSGSASYGSRLCAERLIDSSYSAPEQLQGKPVTRQSDVYSLGVILYELCTGRLPFDTPNHSSAYKPLATLLQSTRSGPTPPTTVNPEISPELEFVILRSIARRPEQRFPDIKSMFLALIQTLDVELSSSLSMAYHSSFLASLREQATIDQHNLAHRSEITGMIATSSSEGQESVNVSSFRGNLGGKSHKNGNSIIGVNLGHRQLQNAQQKNRRPDARGPLRWREVKLVVPSLFSLVLIAFLLFWMLGRGQTPSYGRMTSDLAGGSALGQVLFLSSSQGDITKGQGINDEVRVDLTYLTDPAPGKGYYAWLLADADQSDDKVILLGRLNVTNGSAHLLYKEPLHSDLLTEMSRFLVTEEDMTTLPVTPSLDVTSWWATGEISQAPNPHDQNHFSLLDHLRHLLATDPELEKDPGLQGGLSPWLLYNTAQVQQLGQSAKESFAHHNVYQLRNQLISLLDYLDGVRNVAPDLPVGMPVLVDAPSAQVGILQTRAYQTPTSYLYHVGLHLLGLASSPGVTIYQQKIVAGLVSDINTIRPMLEQVRDIARKLVTSPSDQLLQPSTGVSLTLLAQLALTAYIGQQSNPHGIQWICTHLTSLATINVTRHFQK